MGKIYLALVDRGHAGLKKDQTANATATPGKETPIIKSLGRRIQEEEFNEPTKNFLIEELKRSGVHVVDVSGGERDTPLKERTDYANKIYWQYCSKYGTANVVAIFISIHFNAFDGTFDGKNPSGFSVHVYPGSATGKKLGEAILNELKKGTRQINRGLVEQDLHIVRETVMPAALSENGFMDNPEEAALMLSKDFQKEVAVEHAKGICNYFGIPYLVKPIVKEAVKVKKSAFEKEVEEAKEWVKEKGISDGSRPKDPVTRQEVWIMLKNLEEGMIRKWI
jgi:N-acetylmuramoyl-L-alanine amidase